MLNQMLVLLFKNWKSKSDMKLGLVPKGQERERALSGPLWLVSGWPFAPFVFMIASFYV